MLTVFFREAILAEDPNVVIARDLGRQLMLDVGDCVRRRVDLVDDPTQKAAVAVYGALAAVTALAGIIRRRPGYESIPADMLVEMAADLIIERLKKGGRGVKDAD